MTTVEVLREARELIAGSWRQGAHYSETMSFCPIGALAKVTGDDERAFYKCLTLFADAIGLPSYDTLAVDIAAWNDVPGRTDGEVIAAFDRAIAIAQEEETENEHI